MRAGKKPQAPVARGGASFQVAAPGTKMASPGPSEGRCMADSGGALRPEFESTGQPLRAGFAAGEPRGDRQAAPPDKGRPGNTERASARTHMAAALSFDAGSRDPADLAQASAELWAALFIDEAARGVLRRDGLDPARLPLSGPHPFVYACAEDGALTQVTLADAEGADAESLLDLFRVYFLRRLRG